MVLFDGVCNLCDATVQFIIDRDPRGRFTFAALQSPQAEALLQGRGPRGGGADSVVLIDGDEAYFESGAALPCMQPRGGG